MGGGQEHMKVCQQRKKTHALDSEYPKPILSVIRSFPAAPVFFSSHSNSKLINENTFGSGNAN